MKFYIIEIQNNNGSYAYLIHEANSRLQAESVYHQVLAAAAISTLTSHSATILSGEGFQIAAQCYTHEPEETE